MTLKINSLDCLVLSLEKVSGGRKEGNAMEGGRAEFIIEFPH